ncbi:sensor histidine kinase [Gordonia sp. PDNC005]|uniref:sensor histidine kinase n=1 Tax=unclassified Gordonia (in: high G+C Gram-positive bacteria) TaxID=2657482 RepID=UPI00196332C1|nr:sensor histidine kinase [Gordonia sp. PDNC005]QRY62109.1 sensor histidine kinase [Gordonia sp. PDNC005]
MSALRDRIDRITADDRMPWRQWRWAFGAVWLIFLVYPISSLIGSDHTVGVKALGLALIGAFGLVYATSCILFMYNGPGITTGAERSRWIFAGVLVALVLALFPILHEATFGLAGFLMAIISFIAPRRLQVAVIVALIIAAWAVPKVLGWSVDFGVVAIMAAIGMTMIAMRAVSERESARAEMHERQRELDAELAVVAERESVARDVHDILGHSLTVISVKTELAGRLVDLDPERAKAEIAEVNALTRAALAEVRTTVGRLRTPDLPGVLASAGSALRAAGITADLPDPATVSTPNATLFAWVLRESVTNVVRHSGASSCEVTVTPDTLMVRDDGRGSPLLTFGNGLRGLAERVDAAGGRLAVSSDDCGTVVTATVTEENR